MPLGPKATPPHLLTGEFLSPGLAPQVPFCL